MSNCYRVKHYTSEQFREARRRLTARDGKPLHSTAEYVAEMVTMRPAGPYGLLTGDFGDKCTVCNGVAIETDSETVSLVPADATYTIGVDYECDNEEWWDAARATVATDPDVAAVFAALTGPAGSVSGVSRETMVKVIEWASGLPGWDTDIDHAPHPIFVNAE